MSDIKFYEIDSQSKYHIEVSEIDDIAECGDEFITSEELKDLGIEGYFWGIQYFKTKIVTEIERLRSMVKKGCKSVIIDDPELLEVLQNSYKPVSSFVPNTRRTGNRLTFVDRKEHTQKKVLLRDWRNFVGTIEMMLWLINNVDIKVNQTNTDKVSVVETFKNLFSWEEIEKFNTGMDDGWKKRNEEEMKWMKELYENPELLGKEKRG